MGMLANRLTCITAVKQLLFLNINFGPVVRPKLSGTQTKCFVNKMLNFKQTYFSTL